MNVETTKHKLSIGILAVLGLVFLSALALYISNTGSGHSISPNKIYERLTYALDHKQDLKAVSKELMQSESGLGYILLRPQGGTEFVALFKERGELADAGFLQTLKMKFNELGNSPRGYFKVGALSNYFSQIQNKAGQSFWIQVGSYRSSGNSWVKEVAVMAMFFSFIFAAGLLVYMLWLRKSGELKHVWNEWKTQAQAHAPAAMPATATRPKKPFFEKRKVMMAQSGRSAIESASEPPQEAQADMLPTPTIPTPKSVDITPNMQVAEQKLELTAGKKQADKTNEIELKDSPAKDNHLLYWEHSHQLIEFWKKFLQRLQVFCQDEDYLFLFIKDEDFEKSSLRALSELEPVIGLKGSMFLSPSYLKENRVAGKLALKPLLAVKGSLSPSGSLLQLPLVSNKHIFGALLVYRKGSAIHESQIKHLWKEVVSLAGDILRIKQYDRALRDHRTGLFNNRHFQYSLAQNYKLKGNIPSRSLALLRVVTEYPEGDPRLERAMNKLGASLLNNQNVDEEYFLFQSDGKDFTIALVSEAKPMEFLENKLNKVFDSDPIFRDYRLTLNGGVCVLSDGLYSAKRWLDQAMITMQESVHRGPNYLVQSSNWQKSQYVRLKWYTDSVKG